MMSYLFFHWEASVQRAHIERGLGEAASGREKQERSALLRLHLSFVMIR